MVAAVLLADGRAGAQTDDHVNTRDSTATLVTLGGTAEDGNIEASGDVDIFRFVIAEADAPRDVWVYTEAAASNALGDSTGKLYDDSSNVVAENDDSVFGQSDSHFYLAANLGAGTYYVEVSAVGTGTGEYTLHTRTGTDQSERISEAESATALTLGTPVEGVIGSEDDRDTYRLVLSSDTDVIFYTETDALDSTGALLDDLGGEIEEVDDSELSEGILDFFIGRALEADTYYITVGGSGDSVGTYKLHVESVADTSTTITLDSEGRGTAIGILGDEDDEDIFTFTVSGTKDIFVYTVGRTDTIGEVEVSGIVIENDDGFVSPGNRDFLLGYNSSGNQSVTVTGWSGSTGPYRVFVETRDDPAGSTSTTAIPGEPYVFGVIDSDNEEDWFKLDFSSASADSDLIIFTEGPTDTVGTLYASDGTTEISTDDDSGWDVNFLLKETFAAGETYYLKIEGFYNSYTESDEIGPYVLYAESASALSLGGTITASIDPHHDADLYEIDLSGQSSLTEVWIYATGSLDTFATLYDSDGDFVVWDDDSGLLGQRLAFSMQVGLDPGVYYLLVNTYDTRVGGYGVHLESATDPPNSTSGAPTLSLGQVKTGHIDDADYFQLDLGDKTNVILYMTRYTGFRYDVEVVGQSDVNEYPGFTDHIIRDSFTGSPFIKVTTKTGGRYLLQALHDTAYTNFVTECTADTNALDPAPGDDLYACQWHLEDRTAGREANDAADDVDINVEEVWSDTTLADGTTVSDGIKGQGINVAVVDDGMDINHDDLSPNVNRGLNYDYGSDSYTTSNIYQPAHHHGTAVAGLIAARDNTFGIRGVAPRATLYAHNFLAEQSDYAEADSMSRSMDVTAVSSNSWGPFDGPGLGYTSAAWEGAVEKGVTEGYGGKGVFYAFAAGNGGDGNDNANLDEFANFYAVTSVCAVNSSGVKSDYSEYGASLWVCAPSNNWSGGYPAIVTTENSDRYRYTFGGTSAATPMVSGVAALMRHANPELTWRDIKLILAATASKVDPDSTRWQTGANKYGSTTETYNWNRNYGFGMVDAKAAVDLAKTWVTLAPLESYEEEITVSNGTIPDAPSPAISSTINISPSDTDMEFIEYVEIRPDFTHPSFRDLKIELVSPSGTTTELVDSTERGAVVSFFGFIFGRFSIPLIGTFRMGASQFLGEDPTGNWTLRITDEVENEKEGTLNSWTIKFYGSNATPFAPTANSVTPGEETLTVEWSAPTETRGTEIIAYDLRFKDEYGEETLDEFAWNTGDGELSVEKTGLLGRVEYEVQVRARNSSGPGQWSEAVKATPRRAGGDCTSTTVGGDHTELLEDCNLLLDIRDAIVGSGVPLDWTPTASITQWEGVSTGFVSSVQRVTGIELTGKSLAGTFPQDLTNLDGLETLDLSVNGLTGSIPRELESLTGLTELLLNDNSLSGSIPTELKELTSLAKLHLQENSLSGSIPADFGDLTSLQDLHLENNSLSGNIPTELGDLTSLASLLLGGNSLGGNIPTELETLTSLDTLDLSDNNLNGNIPTELGSLTSLETLDLSDNSLAGNIPTELGSLTSLETLNLSENNLDGNIPAELGSLTLLKTLDLSENRLDGSIPTQLGNLFRLEKLHLNKNRLNGEIPSQLVNLTTSLTELYLADNSLMGCIPGGLRSVSSNDLGDINLVHCDVQLTALAVEGATLSPAFDADTTSYTAVVGPSPATVTPTGQLGVTFEFLDNSDNAIDDADTESGFQVALGSGRTRVKVKVTSEDGQASHTYIIDIDRASAPGRPSISDTIEPTPGDAGSLDVAWTAASSDGGAPVIAYNVRYIESAASNKADIHWTLDEDAWTTGDGTLEATITGLLGDTEHDVQVRAYNGAAYSAWSQTAKGTPDAPDCDAGGPISNPVDNPGLVTDCEALLAAMARLRASGTVNWSINLPMSSWQYITIEGTPQRVTKVELTSLGLDGRIPSSLRQLSGLTTLDLSDNELTQGIPHRLGELSNLQELLLGGNMLGGQIPPELGDLSNLETLGLDSNGLTGQIPGNLRNLSSLTVIELHDNELGGSLPSWLGQISGLKTLSLHGNAFTGSVPSSLGSLSSLEELHLSGNNLTGTIPTQLGNATALTRLAMGNNQLSGSIPSQLSSLTSLTQLALNGNELTRDIPDLSALTLLTELHLNGNQLTGGVPTWLEDLTELTVLDLSGNDLAGEIPSELNSLTKLESLNLGGNGLSGGIPSFASLTALVNLDLSDNALTGEIPTALGDLGVLETLLLSDNNLNGSVPAKIGSLANLQKLNIAGNDLTEELPDELNNLTELQQLDVSENDFAGEIPTLSGLTKLEELKLSDSGLEGEIPALSSLTALRILHLNDNELDGSIPSLSGLTDLEELHLQGNELTGGLSFLSGLSRLKELIASDNLLDGSMSALPSNLTNLEILRLESNQLTGSLPSSLGVLSNLEFLSVANNSLSGSIPGQLGDLVNLRWLYLYSNQISGPIPSRLGDLGSLEELRLESNALTGAIPAQLGGLDSLTLLLLADNQLTGCVPGELMSLPALGDGGTNDLEAVGLPFCPAPTISSVEAGTQSLTVEWNTPTAYEDYVESFDLRHITSSIQDPEEGNWTVVETDSTATTATVTGLRQRTEYDVQVRAVYEAGEGAWSDSFTHRTRQTTVTRRPPSPQPVDPITPVTTTTGGGNGGSSSGSGGGGGGGFAIGGFGGGAPAPAQPRAMNDFQTAQQIFQPLVANGTLQRVWRFFALGQRWLFYDPRPSFLRFNTLRTVNVASDPPAILLVNSTRQQRFRGYTLFEGWNFVLIEAEPPLPRPGRNVQRVDQLLRPLVQNGTLERVWWMDPRTQGWAFYDPDPVFASFNTLSTVDLNANPPVVLVVSVSQRTEFRGITLYPGWNYLVMR